MFLSMTRASVEVILSVRAIALLDTQSVAASMQIKETTAYPRMSQCLVNGNLPLICVDDCQAYSPGDAAASFLRLHVVQLKAISNTSEHSKRSRTAYFFIFRCYIDEGKGDTRNCRNEIRRVL